MPNTRKTPHLPYIQDDAAPPPVFDSLYAKIDTQDERRILVEHHRTHYC